MTPQEQAAAIRATWDIQKTPSGEWRATVHGKGTATSYCQTRADAERFCENVSRGSK